MINTVEVYTSELIVGDVVLAWGNTWRKVLSISSWVAISEYQLEGEKETRRHSRLEKQLIKPRSKACVALIECYDEKVRQVEEQYEGDEITASDRLHFLTNLKNNLNNDLADLGASS